MYVLLIGVSSNFVYFDIHSMVKIIFLLMQENRLLGVAFLNDYFVPVCNLNQDVMKCLNNV
jgi:hypothetical protein